MTEPGRAGDTRCRGHHDGVMPTGSAAPLPAEDELTRDMSSWQRQRRRFIGIMVAAFVLSPAVSLVANHGFAGRALFLLPGAMVFVLAISRGPFTVSDLAAAGLWRRGWLVLIVVLGAALFVVGGTNWLVALACAAAVFGTLVPGSPRLAGAGVACCCALGLGVTTWQGYGYGNALAATAVPALAGMFSYGSARRNALVERLHQTRAELARMAVADERLRIARDLHDLLGHSLSLIALKAELAGRLIGTDTSRAAREIGELETVARRALTEVRQAVTSYRQPGLAAEIATARRMLASAGVDVRVEVPGAYSLPGAVDALLAWTVREGATNIVRHAAAGHARIAIELTPAHAAAVVTDDGSGPPGGRGGPAAAAGSAGAAREPGAAAGPGPAGAGLAAGSGLAGLAERAARLGGTLSAGSDPRGGFRLMVSVPQAGPALAQHHESATHPVSP